MAQSNNYIERTIGEVTFDSGGTSEVPLPKANLLQHLNLLVDYSVTTGTSASQNGNGILELIQNITVEFGGDKRPKNHSLAMGHFKDWYRYGSRPLFDGVDFSTAATQSGTIQTYVDALVRDGLEGTYLPLFAFTDAKLKIKWGTASDIGADVTVDSASVSVKTREKKKSAFSNPQKYAEQVSVYREAEKTKPLNQDGTIPVELTTGNTYTAVPLQVLDGDTPDLSNIESIELVEDQHSTHRDVTPEHVRAENFQQFGLQQLAPGFAVLWYGLRDGEAFNSAGTDRYQLKLNTVGTPTDPSEVKVLETTVI